MPNRYHIYFFVWIVSTIFQMNAHAAETSVSMTFAIYESGGNNSASRWIQASGEIEPDTAEKFRDFLGNDKCNLRVFFNSPGGSLFGGIKLGEAIREAECNTGISISEPYDDSRFRTQSAGSCMSACIFAFIGGVSRDADSEDVIGVHQHYTEDALIDKKALRFSAIDISTTQFIDGLLIAYVRKMGIDPILISIASEVIPSEPIRLLPLELLSEMNVVNSVWRPSTWKIIVSGKGLAATITQPQNAKGNQVTGLFFCGVTGTTDSMLLITIPVDPDQWTVKQLAEGGTIGLGLHFGDYSPSSRDYYSFFGTTSSEVSVSRPVYSVSPSPAGGTILTVGIFVTDFIINHLNRYDGLWISPDANVYNGVLSIKLSLSEFRSAAPFVQQHCQ